jgi:acyl-coenzyme A synthetase/AMP-(fatty) acid ligase
VRQGPLAPGLRRYVAARLSHHKVPADFVIVGALPRNRNGKINRQALRGQEARRDRSDDAATARPAAD